MTNVSVCIVGRNERPTLEESLPMIREQIGVGDIEILFADSASDDGSADVAAEHGARVIFVPEGEFHHALTRRMLAEEAAGEFVCMLTGDATPYDEHWLWRLIEPFQADPLIGMCYSRWYARDDAPPSQRADIKATFPSVAREAFAPADDPVASAEFQASPYQFMFATDVSSAYRRDMFLRIPFTEEIFTCEDQFASYWLIQNGFKVRYCPLSRAYHSHHDTFATERERFRTYTEAFDVFCHVPEPTTPNIFAATIGSLLETIGIARAMKAGIGEWWGIYRSRLARRVGQLDAVRARRRRAK